jgi:hypothetical protein
MFTVDQRHQFRETKNLSIIPNIWWILGLATLLRSLFPILGYAYTRDITIFYTPDSASYLAPARELLAHHRFFTAGAPELIRTPGYPLLLTAGLELGPLEAVTIALQIIISCFTVYLVYRTTRLLFQRELIALIAAALYAIEPFSVLFSSLLASETLFSAVAMIGVYYLVKYLKRERLADLLISGSALAASVYVRPIGYFLPAIVAAGLTLWALVAAPRNKPRLVAHATAFLAVSVGLTALWQVRNKIESDYSGFSAIASDNMYFISAASVQAAEKHVPYYDMRDRLGYQNQRVYFQQHPEQKTWSVAQRANYMNRSAERILLGSPLTFARIYFDGILRATFDPGSTEFLRFFDLYPKQGDLLTVAVDQGIFTTVKTLLASPLLFWSIVLILPLHLMYLSCAAIALCSRATLDRAGFAALFIAAYYMAMAGGPGDWGRFRHPAMPIICIFAASGLCMVMGREASRLRSITSPFAIPLPHYYGRAVGGNSYPTTIEEGQPH